ncbi:MAG: hypothetical protein OEW33_08390 [Nitrospirota bacterium]|jgi:hypothetical protein|nr:hypothetical protein [Nitrospirota bacterium]
MAALFWLRKSLGAVFILICGFGIAYGMDHSRTPHVQVRASPERDVAPSEVRLRVSMDDASSVERIAWDYEGDGTFDAEGPNLYVQTVTFSSTGLFAPTVIVTDKQGQTYEATANVRIESPEDLQAALNARWRGMLAALAKQDIEEAVSFVATRKREVMRHDWAVLSDHLGEIVNLFSVPLQLTDGRGYRVVAKAADPLPMGETRFPLEVEFVWESDHQWYIKSY